MLARVKGKLRQVDETQESIQALSAWLIRHRDDADKFALVWRDEVLEGKSSRSCCVRAYVGLLTRLCFIVASPKRRLLLLYVANDVIQNGRKRAPNIKESLKPYLRDAFALSRCVRVPGLTYQSHLLPIQPVEELLSSQLSLCLSAACAFFFLFSLRSDSQIHASVEKILKVWRDRKVFSEILVNDFELALSKCQLCDVSEMLVWETFRKIEWDCTH